jgi:hypothetical protein
MERFKDAPDKNEWSHVAEAEQYGAIGAGEGRELMMAKVRTASRYATQSAITEYDILGGTET